MFVDDKKSHNKIAETLTLNAGIFTYTTTLSTAADFYNLFVATV